jgi:very-short-patch-repair endonuclease
MPQKRPQNTEPRVWATRDRSVVPVNRIRARAMRQEPTQAERKLWWNLRHRLALSNSHFRQQVHLGRYIVDFASHGLKLVIELDGGQHAVQETQDAARTRFLESEGYRVLRFWNNDVLANIDGVLEVIQNAALTTPTPTPPHKGEGKEDGPTPARFARRPSPSRGG